MVPAPSPSSPQRHSIPQPPSVSPIRSPSSESYLSFGESQYRQCVKSCQKLRECTDRCFQDKKLWDHYDPDHFTPSSVSQR